jgi:hypothetical protein
MRNEKSDVSVIPFVFERNPSPTVQGILFSEDGGQNDTPTMGGILDAREDAVSRMTDQERIPGTRGRVPRRK